MKEEPIFAKDSLDRQLPRYEKDVNNDGDVPQQVDLLTSTQSTQLSYSLSRSNSHTKEEIKVLKEENTREDNSLDGSSFPYNQTFLSLCHWGQKELKKGNYVRAEEIYRQAISEYNLTADTLDKDQLFNCELALAHALRLRQKLDSAESLYQELLSRYRISYGEYHPYTIKCNECLADIKSLRQKQNIHETNKQIAIEIEQQSSTKVENQEQSTSFEFGPWTKLCAAAAYAGTSTFIQLFGKVTLTTYGFPSANVAALLQSVVAVLLLSGAKHILGMKHLYSDITWSSIWSMMPLTIIQVVNVSLGLVGFQLLSLPTYVALRRFTIVLTLLAEVFILKMPASKQVVGSVGLLMLGTLISAWYDLAFSAAGYTAILVADLATASYAIVSRLVLQNHGRTKWEVLMIISLTSIPIFVVILMALNYDGALAASLAAFPHWGDPLFLICFILIGVLGLAVNFTILHNIQVNGPLSTPMIGTAKNIFTTYIGMLGLFGDYIFTVLNFIGLNIGMAGSVWYGFIQYQEALQQQPLGTESSTIVASVDRVASDLEDDDVDEEKQQQDEVSICTEYSLMY
mmetsp:Transcript_14340/g.21878  ORF Transcript_14340/g.21878 Transcript_14340/m.21878 type:complete len:572 (-) Transcript_14340:127-1842(-)